MAISMDVDGDVILEFQNFRLLLMYFIQDFKFLS